MRTLRLRVVLLAVLRENRCVEATIRYARSGDVNIAYQVTGEGPFDLVLVSGFVSHLDHDWAASVFGAAARATGIVCAADPVRQAWDRSLRSRGRAARLRDADGRRACRDGRRRQRARGLVRLFGGWAARDPVRRDVSAARTRRLRCTEPMRSGQGPTTTTRGARRRRNGRHTRPRSKREWGVEADLSRMAPSADESFATLVDGASAGGCESRLGA